MNISNEICDQLITVRDWIRWGTSLFNANQLHFGHGTDNAWDEAVSLVLYALHLPPNSHPQILDARITHEEKKTILALFQTRSEQRIPAAYITHQAWFSGMKFYVDEQVLIPRSSLGEMIEKQFSPWVVPDQVHHILDLCTGSGCIAIATALAFPNATVDAVDISEKALSVARKNILDYDLTHRIRAIHSDLFSGLQGERYDLIVSNPPYVSRDEMALLPPEYRHEPTLGLLAEDEGLAIVLQILQQAAHFLTHNGILVVEVGNSEEALIRRFPEMPFIWVEFEHSEGGVFVLARDQLEAFVGDII